MARARIVATLAVVALAVGGLDCSDPTWNPWLPPAVLALATLAVGVQVLRRSIGLDPGGDHDLAAASARSPASWRWAT